MYLVTVKRRVNFHKFLVVNSITLPIVSKCMKVLARLSQHKFISTNNVKRMIQLHHLNNHLFYRFTLWTLQKHFTVFTGLNHQTSPSDSNILRYLSVKIWTINDHNHDIAKKGNYIPKVESKLSEAVYRVFICIKFRNILTYISLPGFPLNSI